MRDPKRLADSGSPELIETLKTAQEMHDTPAQIDRLWSDMGDRLQDLGPALSDISSAPLDASSATSSILASTKGIWLSTMVVCGGLGLWLDQMPEPHTPAAVVPSGALAEGPEDALVPPEMPLPEAAPLVAAPLPAAPPTTVELAPVRARRPSGATTTRARTDLTSPRSTRKRPAAAHVDQQRSEVALIQQADAALASDPARTLALVRSHARRFPAGALAQERELMRIEALRRLSRRSEAEARARSFVRAFPDSPHRHQMEQLLRGGPLE